MEVQKSLSDLTQSALADFQKAAGTPLDGAELQKTAGISQATGLVWYDLQNPSKNLFPVLTPLRNKLPRVGASGGTATNWKAVTGVNTAGLQGFVPEGVRNGLVTTAVEDRNASYRTLGLEDAVTFEADLAAKNLEDVRSTTAQRLLWATMIQEELSILGANGSNGVALGTPAGLTVTPVVSGGSIPDAVGGYDVRVVALTLMGARTAGVTLAGVQQVVTVTSADGSTFTYNGGSSMKSASVNSGAVAGTVANTSSIQLSCNVVTGAVAYAWFGIAAGGDPVIQGISYINSFLWKTVKTGTQPVSLITADCSKNALAYEGMLTQAWMSGSNAYIKNMATGTPGTGTGLTASGRGTITEIDAMIQALYDGYKIVPDEIFVSAQEINNMGSKMFGGTVNGNLRYTVSVDGGGEAGNSLIGGISSILYPNLLGLGRRTIPVTVHPNMPPGTILAPLYNLPYPINGVPNVMEMKLRRDYYQIDWPQRTRKYESGVYCDGCFVHYFPPSLGMITNIANA